MVFSKNRINKGTSTAFTFHPCDMYNAQMFEIGQLGSLVSVTSFFFLRSEPFIRVSYRTLVHITVAYVSAKYRLNPTSLQGRQRGQRICVGATSCQVTGHLATVSIARGSIVTV